MACSRAASRYTCTKRRYLSAIWLAAGARILGGRVLSLESDPAKCRAWRRNIAEAGLEPQSITANGAQVLVAVTVKTSNAGAPDQAPRAWRMRITVQKVGDEAKVANVEFVP